MCSAGNELKGAVITVSSLFDGVGLSSQDAHSEGSQALCRRSRRLRWVHLPHYTLRIVVTRRMRTSTGTYRGGRAGNRLRIY